MTLLNNDAALDSTMSTSVVKLSASGVKLSPDEIDAARKPGTPTPAQEDIKYLNKETQDAIIAKFPETKSIFDSYNNNLNDINTARVNARSALDESSKALTEAETRDNNLIDLNDAVRAIPADENFNTKLEQLFSEKKYSLTDAEIAELKNLDQVGILNYIDNKFKATQASVDSLKADYEAKHKAHEDLVAKTQSDRKQAAETLFNSLRDLGRSNPVFGRYLDAMARGQTFTEYHDPRTIGSEVAAERGLGSFLENYFKNTQDVPAALRNAYEKGEPLSEDQIKALPRNFQGVAKMLNHGLDGDFQKYGQFIDGLTRYAAAKGKTNSDGSVELPGKVGQLGFKWNEDGTLKHVFFGDNKAYYGTPDLLKLSGLLMENPGKFAELYLVNGRIDNRQGDKKLAELLGVSHEAIKEFFASFPGSSALPNAVKNGTIKPEQIADCIAACMGNQIHIAERLINNKGIKRDEFRHVLMNVTSPSTLIAAGITAATGGTGAQIAYSVVLNSVPMGDGLRLLLGLAPGALGFFGGRSRSIRGGSNGGGNGNGSGEP